MDTPPLEKANLVRDVEQLREQLVMLAVACPYTKSNPITCPLHEVRRQEPAAILDWLDNLSREEKDFLILYHQCCLVAKWEDDMLERLQRTPEVVGANAGAKHDTKAPGVRARQPTKPRKAARAARGAG